jgi:hypothetical protein
MPAANSLRNLCNSACPATPTDVRGKLPETARQQAAWTATLAALPGLHAFRVALHPDNAEYGRTSLQAWTRIAYDACALFVGKLSVVQRWVGLRAIEKG